MPRTIIETVLRIGSIELDFPVVQAALAGYSDAPMRIIARRHGAPYASAEVILDQAVTRRGRIQRRLLRPPANEDHPVGAQLLGAEPAEFAAAAELLVTAGYDVIDLNFACPVRKVLGRCRGGHLLTDPSRALEIIRAVRQTLPPRTPLTVKLRRGYDDTPTSEHNFLQILDGAIELGVSAITVHGRTVLQRYRGPSNWDALRRVKQHVGDFPILGSGDLFSADDVQRMLAQTGVDGVTLARGCIGNPWLFAETRAVLAGEPLPDPPAVPEQGRVIREHFDLSLATHGPRLAGRILRKFGIKYSELHPQARDVRDAFAAAGNEQEWLRVLDEWYSPNRAWPPGRRKHGPGDLVAAGAS